MAAGCASPGDLGAFSLVVAEEARYQFGDDPRWATPDWGDEAWPLRSFATLPDSAGVLWLRMRLDVPPTETLGLVVAAAAAREVYWDGVLLGTTGRVGASRAEEVPGPMDALVRVPDSLAAPGPHVVALRLSSFHRPEAANGLLLHVVAGEYRALIEETLLLIALPLVFLGAFVLVALYHGLLFAADRRWASLLTAALCLSLALLLVAEGWRLAVGYPYDWHVVRLRIVEALSWASGSLLVATLAAQFALPQRRTLALTVAGLLALLLFVIGPHEAGTFAVFAVAIACALGITGWAVVQHKPGARFVFAGVAVCFAALVFARLDFMESALFPAFGVLIAGLLTHLGLQSRRQHARHNAALATAARLEAELLRKHLQPHFLMNALTSILEWVETDPPQGARALEALSAELRTLADVSGERLIPMARELALCRTHLDVMGYRKGNTFALEATGVDGEALIPPAVIHTLVENAITHNAYAPGLVRFALHEARTATHRTLTFSAPLAPRPSATQALKIRPERGGLRYIRARLDECAPGRWSLDAGPESGAWVTRLRLPLDLAPVPSR
ncbi:MAG: histidine kinase [Bacteroidota bacterium]